MKGLIVIYLLTAIASLVALRRPKIGLYVYVGFAVLRPQAIWGWAGNLDRVSFIVGSSLLAGWAMCGFGSWKLGRGRSILLAFVFFGVWTTLSAIQATDPALAFGAVVELLKILLPFCVGVTMLTSEAEWLPLLWTIVLAQGYVGFEQNLNYLRGYNSAAEGFGGMDNNCFGVALVTTIGPAIALALAGKKWYLRIIAAGAAALIVHTTLLTFSRGAMVGLLAVGASAVLVLPKRPKYLIPVVIALLLALRFTGPQLAERYASAFASGDERDGSAESRLDLWADCLKVVASKPIFGVGPWNWRVVAESYGWTPGKSAHSVWMETAAETGVPGVLALLMFFGLAGMKMAPVAFARQTAANREQKVLAAGIMMSMIGFAVSGQFVSVTGLEAPYYVAMVAAIMLKVQIEKAPVAAPRLVKSVLPPPPLSAGRSRVVPARSGASALGAFPRR